MNIINNITNITYWFFTSIIDTSRTAYIFIFYDFKMSPNNKI